MQIMEYIDLFLGALLNFFIYAIVAKKLFKLTFCKNKMVLIMSVLLIGVVVGFINLFNKTIFKILLIMPLVIIAFKIVFNIKYKDAIAYVIVGTIYAFIGEIVVAIILSLLPFDYIFIFNNILGTTIGAICVGIFTILLLFIKPLNNKIIYINNSIKNKENAILYILIFIAIGAFGYKNVINIDSPIDLIMNIIICISFLVIFDIYFEENAKLYELSKNYNILFNYLEKYEKELMDKRKIIHDYKNQIIIMNGYIGCEEKLKEYIKELMKEQRSIKEDTVIKNIDKLPRGIKGLIYYKFSNLCHNIVVDIQVKNKLSKIDNLSPKLNKDLLKIIGILIDNAIDAAEEETNGYINIVFAFNKNIFKMIISNSCSKDLKINNITKPGYSTKGKDRGYGLALIEDILKNENSIDLKINIENKEFIATLEVKI